MPEKRFFLLILSLWFTVGMFPALVLGADTSPGSPPPTSSRAKKIPERWLVAQPLAAALTAASFSSPGQVFGTGSIGLIPSERPPAAQDAEDPSATQPLDVKVLNAIRSLQQEGVPDLLGKVIRTYMAESPCLLEKLSSAVKQEDSSVIFQTAHSLKSSSANIGALNLAELLQQLEAMAKDQSLGQAPTVLATISREYERVRTALQLEVSG